MSETHSTNLWYTGVYLDTGLDYFEPATTENALFAIRRAKGLSENHPGAKAFSVPLTLETEETVLELLQLGELQYAKLVITSQKEIQYVD